METKTINSITAVAPNNSRKIVCGDGVMTVEALKQFFTLELSQQLQNLSATLANAANDILDLETSNTNLNAAINSINANLSALSNQLANITTGGLLFNAVGFQLMQNGEIIENEYGYLVMKKTASGSLTFSALNQSEYETIFKKDN